MIASPTARLLDVREVGRSLHVSRSTVYELLRKDPDFPRPVKIGSSTRWVQQDLDGHIRAKRRIADIEDLL